MSLGHVCTQMSLDKLLSVKECSLTSLVAGITEMISATLRTSENNILCEGEKDLKWINTASEWILLQKNWL